MIKKADIILACFLVIAGLALSYFFSFGQSAGDRLDVTCDGELFGSYPLSEDREITVDRDGHLNKITIEDGHVSMSFSDCRGQDCIHQGSISKTGESIICLPNKVILEISGGTRQYDTIAR